MKKNEAPQRGKLYLEFLTEKPVRHDTTGSTGISFHGVKVREGQIFVEWQKRTQDVAVYKILSNGQEMDKPFEVEGLVDLRGTLTRVVWTMRYCTTVKVIASRICGIFMREIMPPTSTFHDCVDCSPRKSIILNDEKDLIFDNLIKVWQECLGRDKELKSHVPAAMQGFVGSDIEYKETTIANLKRIQKSLDVEEYDNWKIKEQVRISAKKKSMILT